MKVTWQGHVANFQIVEKQVEGTKSSVTERDCESLKGTQAIRGAETLGIFVFCSLPLRDHEERLQGKTDIQCVFVSSLLCYVSQLKSIITDGWKCLCSACSGWWKATLTLTRSEKAWQWRNRQPKRRCCVSYFEIDGNHEPHMRFFVRSLGSSSQAACWYHG